jgi:hypothetical protein
LSGHIRRTFGGPPSSFGCNHSAGSDNTQIGNTDKEVIAAFVAHLGHDGLTVDAWPDIEEHKKGKKTEPAIDATAEKFAIEHTSIDALPNKREADASFTASIGCLEGKIDVPFHLEVFVKMDAITKGQKYAATREAVRRWIVEDAPKLADGQHDFDAVLGVPFALFVRKHSNVEASPMGQSGPRIRRRQYRYSYPGLPSRHRMPSERW